MSIVSSSIQVKKLVLAFIIIVCIVAGAYVQLTKDQDASFIAMGPDHKTYAIDTVDTKVTPFALMDLDSLEVTEIGDPWENPLSQKPIETAVAFVQENFATDGGSLEPEKMKLQAVVLSAAVIDSDQSAKIILQLKYEEDMGAVEEIPIIIDGEARFLSEVEREGEHELAAAEDQDVEEMDHYTEKTVYIYRDGSQFKVLSFQ